MEMNDDLVFDSFITADEVTSNLGITIFSKEKKLSKSAGHVQKYWFARGYYDRLAFNEKSVPQIELVEYLQETVGVNILTEYEGGYDQAEKDKVNHVI